MKKKKTKKKAGAVRSTGSDLAGSGDFVCQQAQQIILDISEKLSCGQQFSAIAEQALSEFARLLGYTKACLLEISPDESQLTPMVTIGGQLPEVIELDHPVELLSGSSASKLLGKDWKCGISQALVFQDIPYGLLCFGAGGPGKASTETKKLLKSFSIHLCHAFYTSSLSEYGDLEVEFSHALKAELLSEKVPAIEDFSASLHLLRCAEGGGDFHDFMELPNGKVVITIGKTSGWGVKASLNLAHLIPATRGQISSGKPLSEIMAGINEDLISHSNRSQLVSIAMMILDTRTRKARICRAGSVKMLRFKGGKLSVFEQGLAPHLGAFSGVNLTEVEMQFAPEDSLALMTDGINKFAENKNFSLQKLSEKLATKMEASGGLNLADQVAMLLKESRSGSTQYDVTVLGLQRMPKKSARGMKQMP